MTTILIIAAIVIGALLIAAVLALSFIAWMVRLVTEEEAE